ncbi:3-deoxy-D-manno-octulosonic acid transferase [uncultured Enterovirga sp.]|uniref:3-deoxy-D-manno-octulosonic acid transferase n=1 Tax=uncultured Enterovirga sp. TaxID=2026352 RepID=UPI0035CA5590
MTRRLPAPLLAYRAATILLSPLAPALLRWRAGKGKEDPDRLGERRARPGRARPPGNLVWAHGASIGETQALLPVVEALVGRGLKVLVTSGTRTSAEILARRLPPGARHQYLPLDVPHLVARFLAHWQPCLAVFAESEIWPNTILELDRRHVPLVLVNGRVSVRSFDGWRRAPSVAASLFGRFALCMAQSRADAERLSALGAPHTEVAGNLKFDIAPLPADPGAVESLAGLLAGRPIWMAASTHPGEEEAVIWAHLQMRQRRPNLLTLLAPRHPARGDEIADYAASAGLSVTRRSEGGRPDEAGDLHIVDTVGDLGLFYRLAPLVFMGGSLVPHGGQNPIEPARLGAAILHGPHVANFSDVYAALDRSGGALAVADDDALAAAAEDLLRQPGLVRDMARTAAATVGGLGGALARTLAAIEPFLPPPRDPREALW